MHRRLLVVANRTVDAPALMDELRRRAAEQPTRFTLLVPAAWSEREEATRRATSAATEMRDAGLEIDDAIIGDADPLCAVEDAWDPRRYDEVLVATLPTASSRWLLVDLPHRVRKFTDARVHHIEVEPAPEPAPPLPSSSEIAQDPFLVKLLASLRISTRSG
jgi:hypothetical protein